MSEDEEIVGQVEVCFDGTLFCPRDQKSIYWEDCVGCENFYGREADIDCFLINCALDEDYWLADDYERDNDSGEDVENGNTEESNQEE